MARVSVMNFYLAIHPKTQWLKATMVFPNLTILWVRTVDSAWLGTSSAPCSIDRGHSMVFNWQMGWSGGPKMASLTCLGLW